MSLFPIAAAFAWMAHALPGAFDGFARAAAPLAVAALWQGAVVAAGLALCLRLAPRISATHRFAAWAAGFAVLVCLPFLPGIAHLAGRVSAGANDGAAAVASAPSQPWFQLDARWSLVLAALWLAVSLLRAADLAVHSLRLRKLWKSAVPIDESTASSLAASPVFEGRSQSEFRAEICTTSAIDRPSVIGFFAPRILIPDWLLARITREELEQVVLHEAEHLRRRDDWTNLVQKLCLVAFPLNPALAWIERRLSKEREMACDEGVVRRTHAPRAYAACLASLAERGLEQNLEQGLARRAAAALSLGAWHRRPELVHRVHSILLRKRTLNPVAARALLTTVGCGLLVGSVELARCPQVVAFVPAHPVAQAESAQFVPAAYLPSNRAEAGPFPRASALRATNVEAVLPAAAHRAIRPRMTNSLHSRERAAAMNATRQQMLKSEAITGSAETSALRSTGLVAHVEPQQQPQRGQQWIVLTTWEQVETSTPAAGSTADYDSGAARTPVAARQPESRTAERFTVTRLILRVYPANWPANRPASPAARPDSGSVSNSVINRPPVFPLGDGWLVIQL